MKKVLLLILTLLLAQNTFAGGSSFQMKIKSFRSVGNEKYIMEIEQLSDSYSFGKSTDKHRTIRLRFAPEYLGNKPHSVTKENYAEAIKKLQADFEKGEPIDFGTMGKGLNKIWFKKNHWQSNALSIKEEYGGKMVVYSFVNPI